MTLNSHPKPIKHRMGLPIRHLPVVQNWDCHVCGTCCKEYQVPLTEEERKRIDAQGWGRDADLDGRPPYRRVGPPWARRWVLNHRPDGSCVFLSEQGRCRIHEKFGYQTKPLPCRLFPFVLVPVGTEWRVGLRFACPSAAANKGRPASAHDPSLREFAAMLAQREGLAPRPDGSLVAAPPLQGGQRLNWPNLLRVVDGLMEVLRDRRDPLERRWRKCLALAEDCREAKIERLRDDQVGEFVQLMTAAVEDKVPMDAGTLKRPSWVGRVLFRQFAAIYSRKDHGPNRGPALGSGLRGVTGRLGAAARFTRGVGQVPRLHAWLPETTFEKLEEPVGPLPREAEEVLERYYTLKVGALQFCGPANGGVPFWEGLEALALTFPVLLWVSRAFLGGSASRAEAVVKALSIVDDHFGFNRVLTTGRNRLSLSILASQGELPKLIAWYGR